MEALGNIILIVVGLSLTPWVQARSRHRQMTLEVAAGYEECFFVDNVKTGQAIDFEFQVTGSSAATGNNDITVRLETPYPSFQQLYQDYMVKSGEFVGNIEEDGDYRICFDNRNSRWSDKTVWFEVQVEDPEDDYDDDYIDTDEWDKMKELNEDTMSMFEMKVDDIKTMLHTIRLKINKIRHFFFMHSGSMSKDTNQVDSNFERINFWSTVHLIMMLVVGVTQVVMVRNFFCDKSMSKI